MAEDGVATGIAYVPVPKKDLDPSQIKTYKVVARGKTYEIPYYPTIDVRKLFREMFGMKVSIVEDKEFSGPRTLDIKTAGKATESGLFWVRYFTLVYEVTDDTGKRERLSVDFSGAAPIRNSASIHIAKSVAMSNAIKELMGLFGKCLVDRDDEMQDSISRHDNDGPGISADISW